MGQTHHPLLVQEWFLQLHSLLYQLSAYMDVVHPHLEFASTDWNANLAQNIGPLEAVQRCASRQTLYVTQMYGFSGHQHMRISPSNR